jgi:hypothetical protein
LHLITYDRGGGIFVGHGTTLSLVNTVVSGNYAPPGHGPEIYASATSVVFDNGNNVFGSRANAGVVGFTPDTAVVPSVPANQVVRPDTGVPPAQSPAVDSVTDGSQPVDETTQDGNGDDAPIPDSGAIEAPNSMTPEVEPEVPWLAAPVAPEEAQPIE